MSHVVVVTPNPAIDVTYRVASDRSGRSHRVVEVSRRVGGKGVNVAVGLRTLGREPLSVLPLGGWTGAWCRSQLHESGLRHRVVDIAGETRSTVTTVRADGAHPTVFLEPGPTLRTSELRHLDDAVQDALSDAGALVVSGSLPGSTPPDVVGDWVAAGRRAGVLTVVDTSGEGLLVAARAGADIVMPNAAEARAATAAGSTPHAAARLLAAGARTAVLSAGADGLEAYDASGRTRVPAVPGVRGNPTGAGDAATAGLVAALVAGRSLDAALRSAAAAGAAAVLAPDAGGFDATVYAEFATGSEDRWVR